MLGEVADKQVFTVREVAEILGFSANSIYKFLKEGRIHGKRMGRGRFRIPREEVERFLTGKKGQQAPTAKKVPKQNSAQAEITAELKAETRAEHSVAHMLEAPLTRAIKHDQNGAYKPRLLDWYVGLTLVVVAVAVLLMPTGASLFIKPIILRVIAMGLMACGLGVLWSDVGSAQRTAVGLSIKATSLVLIAVGLVPIFVTLGDFSGAGLSAAILSGVLISLLAIEEREPRVFLLVLTVGLAGLWYDAVRLIQRAGEDISNTAVAYGAMGGLALGTAILVAIGILASGRWQQLRRAEIVFWLVGAAVLVASSALYLATGSSLHAALLLVLGVFIGLIPWRDQFHHVPVRRQGIVSAIFLWVAVLLVGILVGGSFVQRGGLKLYMSEASVTAENAGGVVGDSIREVRRSVQQAADDPTLTTALEGEAGEGVEAATAVARAAYESASGVAAQVFVTKTDGSVAGQYPRGVPTAFEQVVVEQLISESITRGVGVFPEPIYPQSNVRGQAPVMVVVTPVRSTSSRAVVGAVAALVDGQQLASRLNMIRFREAGHVVVIDRAGRYFIHPDPAQVGAAAPEGERKDVRLGETAAGLTGPQVQAATLVPEVEWIVAAQHPVAGVYQFGSWLTGVIAVALLGAVGLSLGVAVRLLGSRLRVAIPESSSAPSSPQAGFTAAGVLVAVAAAAGMMAAGSYVVKEYVAWQDSVQRQLSVQVTTGPGYLDEARLTGARVRGESLALAASHEEFAAYRVTEAQILDGTYQGAVAVEFPSGEQGRLTVQAAGADVAVLLKDGGELPARLIEPLVAQVELADGRALPLRIVSGAVRDGQLTGEIQGQAYGYNWLIAGKLKEDGTLTEVVVKAGGEPTSDAAAAVVNAALAFAYEETTELPGAAEVVASALAKTSADTLDTAGEDVPGAAAAGRVAAAISSQPYLVASSTPGLPVATYNPGRGTWTVGGLTVTPPAEALEKEGPTTVSRTVVQRAGVQELKSDSLEIAVATAEGVATLTFSEAADELAAGSVTSLEIKDGTIVNADISSEAAIDDAKLATIDDRDKVHADALQLNGSGGLVSSGGLSLLRTCSTDQVLSWSGSAWVCTAQSSGSGDIEGVTAGSALSGGGTSGTVTLDLDLLDSADGTGGTSSQSGLEFQGSGSDELTLLQGCADGEVIKWDNTDNVWECASDNNSGGGGGGSSGTAPFTVTHSGSTTVDGIVVDNTSSGIITDGLDVSDGEIVNAINIGPNRILGTTGWIDLDNFDVSTDGTVTIAAGQKYTGVDAVTVSSGGGAALTLDSASNTLVVAASDTAIAATGVATLTLGTSPVITTSSGGLELDSAGGTTTIDDALVVTGTISDSNSNLILDDIVDIGSAATGINITTAGVITDSDGNVTIADNTDITGNLDVSGTLTSGTADAFTVATSGNITTAGDLAVNGDDITSDGDLTINVAGGQLLLADGDVLNIGGLTGVAYNAISDAGTTSHSLASDDDLYVEGDVEIDGTLFADGTLTAGDLTCTDCLDFADFENTLDLDEATEINLGANNFTIDLDSTGEFAVQDGGSDVLRIEDVSGLITISDDLDLSLAADENLALNYTDTVTPQTDAIAITGAAGTTITDAIDVSDAEITNALNIGDNTITGLAGIIDFTDFDVSADGLITVANDADGAGLTISPSVATTTAIDVTDTDIVNALSVGDNTIAGTAAVIDFTDFDVSADGLITVANDADGAGLTISPSVATTTAIDVTDTDIVNALSVGDNTILGTAAVIDFTDFDVSADGLITIAPDDASSGTGLAISPSATLGTGINFGSNITTEMVFTDTTPTVQLANASTLSVTDGTNNLLSMRDLSTNFGAALTAGAFIDRNSYFGEEFNHNREDCTISQVQSRGDHGSPAATCAANTGEITFNITAAGTGDSCTAASQNTVNGLERITASSTVGLGGISASCLESLGTEDVLTNNNIFDADNLPVVVMKARSNEEEGANQRIVLGLGDMANTATDTLPTNGIYFSNCNGSDTGSCGAGLHGVVRNGALAGNVSTVQCQASWPTTMMHLRVEVRSTTDVHFYYDADVSDGISETECGAGVTEDVPSAALSLNFFVADTSTSADTAQVDIDYFRVWQDDAAASIQVAGMSTEPNMSRVDRAGAVAGVVNQVDIAGLNLTAGDSALGEKVLAALKTAGDIFTEPLTHDYRDVLAAGVEVVAPYITTEHLAVKEISGLAGGNVEVALADAGSFVVKKKGSDAAAATIDTLGNAKFAGVISAAGFDGPLIGLDEVGRKVDDLSGRVAGLQTSPMPAPAFTVAPSATIDMTTLQQLSVSGALAVAGHLQVGADTAGVAQILPGADRVEVTFVQPYGVAPIVTAQLTLPDAALARAVLAQDVRYVVADRSTSRFTIVVNRPAADVLTFNWTALAGSGRTVFSGSAPAFVNPTPVPPSAGNTSGVELASPEVKEVPSATPSATASPEPTAAVSPSPEALLTPTPAPSPTVTPTPTPEGLTATPQPAAAI